MTDGRDGMRRTDETDGMRRTDGRDVLYSHHEGKYVNTHPQLATWSYVGVATVEQADWRLAQGGQKKDAHKELHR